MLRDSKKLNVQYCSFNHHILIKNARVVDNQICYHVKYDSQVKQLFDTRYNLYRDCYYHRVTQMHELLILDILQECEGVLYNFLEAVNDPEQYLYLEDSIIHEVRISTDPRLKRARELVDRYDSRILYSFVGEKGLSTDVAKRLTTITEQEVIDAYKDML